MRIALVQQRAGTDKAANVRRGLEALEVAAKQGANLVCFPELAFERFYPQRPAGSDCLTLAEPVPGPTTEAFQDRARARSTARRSSMPMAGCWVARA